MALLPSSFLGGGSFYRPPTTYTTPTYKPPTTSTKTKGLTLKLKARPNKPKATKPKARPNKPRGAKPASQMSAKVKQQLAAKQQAAVYDPYLPVITKRDEFQPNPYLPLITRGMIQGGATAPGAGLGEGVYFNPYRGTTSLAQYYGRGWLDPMFVGGSILERVAAGLVQDPRQYTTPELPGPALPVTSGGYGGGGGGYYSGYGGGGYYSGGGGGGTTPEEEQRPPLWIPPQIIWRL